MPATHLSDVEPTGSTPTPTAEVLTAQPLGAACGEFRAQLLAAVDQVGQVGSTELAEVAGAVAGVKAACDALLVALTREAVTRGVVAASTSTTPTAWLSAATGTEPRAVSPIAQAAAAGTDPRNTPVTDRVVTGTMSPQLAVTVVREVDKLMPRLPQQFDRAEVLEHFVSLIDQGGTTTTTTIRELAKRVLARYGGDALEAEVTRQHDHETLSWWTEPSGMVGFQACLAADHAALIIAGITARSAPQPGTDPTTGLPVKDLRSPGKRRADALVELVTRAMSVDLDVPMGAATNLVVTIDLDTLLTATTPTTSTTSTTSPTTSTPSTTASTSADATDAPSSADKHRPGRAGKGYATTGENTTLDLGALRRLACDANIIPVVLGTGSAPLDVGRTKRLATREIRTALALRDHGCTYPGCDRPPGWCRAHHLTAWTHNGETALTNLTLLCERHHTIVHRDHLTATLEPDGTHWHPPNRHTTAA